MKVFTAPVGVGAVLMEWSILAKSSLSYLFDI